MNTEMDDNEKGRAVKERQKQLKAARLNKQRNNSFNTKKSELRTYLLSIDPAKADDALKALVQIANDYKKACQPINDEVNGKNIKEKSIHIKHAMEKLQPKLMSLSKVFDEISYEQTSIFALTEFDLHMHAVQTLGMNRHGDNEIESSTTQFSKLVDEAYKATTEIIAQHDRHLTGSTDEYRTYAAREVVSVLVNVLNKKVVMTPCTAINLKSKPTTALYCRLLKMTLSLADDYNFDMQKLMTAGIDLSKDSTPPPK
jgi:hypothetical protein